MTILWIKLLVSIAPSLIEWLLKTFKAKPESIIKAKEITHAKAIAAINAHSARLSAKLDTLDSLRQRAIEINKGANGKL